MKIKDRVMKDKIDIDDFLVLISWTKIHSMLDGETFEYENLLEQAMTYKHLNTPFDIRIHRIDDLLIDSYKAYDLLRKTEVQVKEIVKQIKIPNITGDVFIEHSNKYKEVFENIMENCEFTDPEIIGIQKGLLSEIIKKYVAEEDYETAAKIRDIINAH